MDPSGLLPYQVPAAEMLLAALRRYGAALDGSACGVGKTYVAMAIARHFEVAPLVVCPKAVRSTWTRVAAHMGGRCYTINYEMLRTGRTEWGSWELIREEVDPVTGKKKKIQRFVFNSEIPLIIWDEVHRSKSMSSLNSKMLIAAGRQQIPSLCLSATAARDPLDMKALGFLLKLHDGNSFFKFARIFGCRMSDHGLQFVGGQHQLRRLHELIFPDRGIRITREELGSAFPDCQITAELYDLPGDDEEIAALYAEMEEPLKRLQDRMLDDADLEHPLTKILRARQRIELLKVPLFVDLFENAIDNGMRPVLFVNFIETVNALRERIKRPLSFVVGGQTGRERDQNVARFQANETDGSIVNSEAGGTGLSLHDLDGRYPRISYISPTYSALTLEQVLGRIWRQEAKSKALQRIVLIAGTVEEKIQKALSRNLDKISLINDNDLNDIFRT